MIPLYTATTTRNLLTYNSSLKLNDPADEPNDTYAIDTVTVVSPVEQVSDPKPKDDGSEIYDPRKSARIYRLAGFVYSTSYARLFDKAEALAAAFDPARLAHEDSTGGGFKNLVFNVPTEDTTNYTTGLISCFISCRARAPIDFTVSKFYGLSLPILLDLIVPDPLRYYSTQQTATGAATINNSLAGYRSWPTLTITMAGAGNAAYAITNTNTTATTTLTLDLSACVAADVVTVNFKDRSISVAGTGTAAYVSGDYFQIEPLASNAITYANTTNATSVLSYYRAFSV